jgi:MSHA biogenesis protein MshQ
MVALGCATANADTLTGTATADDQFLAFISTDNSTLGTPIGSGNLWLNSFPVGSGTLTPGTTYYLHIIAINTGGPEGFIGSFSLNGTGFKFSNGTQTLVTNTANWSGIAVNDPNVWTTPTGPVQIDTSYIGSPYSYWGVPGTIDPSAQWIWANPTVGYYADLSTTIYSTPEPGTIILLGSGLLGLVGVVRRKLGICA